MGLNNRISSVRPVAGRNTAQHAIARVYLAVAATTIAGATTSAVFEADVTSVRAVVGPPEQRCWVERQDVVDRHPATPRFRARSPAP